MSKTTSTTWPFWDGVPNPPLTLVRSLGQSKKSASGLREAGLWRATKSNVLAMNVLFACLVLFLSTEYRQHACWFWDAYGSRGWSCGGAVREDNRGERGTKGFLLLFSVKDRERER